MNITAEFVTSAVRASDLPADGLAAVALIGRSNVGKSSLINALVRRTVARTSGAPGKTRLANIYRVVRGRAAAMYVFDLPGYGYARGGNDGFDAIVRAVLGQDRRDGQEKARNPEHAAPAPLGAILLVDARHPGLANDIEAWQWLQPVVERRAVVATKIDKLTRGERIRAMGQLESVFEHPVLPVSATTGEGLDELWKLIDNLVNSPRHRPSRAPDRQPPSKATARPPRKR